MSTGAVRLLLVEDNPGDALLAREHLSEVPDCDFSVLQVSDLNDAIRTLGEQQVDAIVLDLELPDSTGIDTVVRLRKAHPDIAVVVLSGHRDEALRRDTLLAGAQDFLEKGQRPAHLLARSVLHALERFRAQEQQRLVELLVAVSPDGVVVTDSEGKVQFANEAALGLFGRRREDFMGAEPGFSVEAGEVREIEVVRSGARRIAEMRITEFQWGGRPAFLATLRDVTEQRMLAEHLRHSQKMEAIGRLAGGVAHDFNNLLTVILGYGRFLLDEMAETDPKREDVLEIIHAVDHATALTKQLLTFSRRQPEEPQVLDPNDVVTRVHGLLRRALPASIEVVAQPRVGAWSVRADSDQIEQALMNLAVNARDAMPNGGTLTLRVDNVEVKEASGDLAAGEYVLLETSDTGTGIAPELMDRIFEPFFTTKEAGKGTGLGLASCYGAALQAGGSLTVESDLGAGATFRLLLPRSDASEIAPEEPPAMPEQLGGSETILVAEDSEGVRRSTTRLLERSGYTVLQASDGEEAKSLIERHAADIALVLSDVMMPRCDGRELASWLRAEHLSIPVVFMTGYSQESPSGHGRELEGVAFLRKPFLPDDLLRQVRRAVEGH